MFARITVLDFLPDAAQRGFDVVQRTIVPSIRAQPGFRGLLLLRDSQTGGATVVTLWASRADMEATATGNYPVQLAKIEPLLSGPPTRHTYEVADASLALPP